MDDDKKIIPDWTNLPTEVEQISLWHVLHDATVRSIRSDLLACSMRMEFDVAYLRNFHRLPDDLSFNLDFSGVQSVRVLRYNRWPGEFSLPKGISRDEEARLVSEYHSKWREESESWTNFEAQVAQSDDASEVLDAELVIGRDRVIALKLGIQLTDDSSWVNVFVRTKSLDIRQSDGKNLSIQDFLKLGEAYWQEFAARRD